MSIFLGVMAGVCIGVGFMAILSVNKYDQEERYENENSNKRDTTEQ